MRKKINNIIMIFILLLNIMVMVAPIANSAIVSYRSSNSSSLYISSNSNFGSTGRQLVRSSTGTLYEAYYTYITLFSNYIAGITIELSYNNGVSWSSVYSNHSEVLSSSSDYKDLGIAIDSNDVIHGFYMYTYSGYTYIKYINSTEFSAAPDTTTPTRTLEKTTNTLYSGNIFVNSLDEIFITFKNDTRLYIKESIDGGITWGSNTQIVTIYGHGSYSAAVDLNDKIHIVYAEDEFKLKYINSSDSGATWTAPITIFDSGAVQYIDIDDAPSICIDKSNNIYVAIHQDSTGNILYTKKAYVNTTFDTYKTLTCGTPIARASVSISIDDRNYIYITFPINAYNLGYIENNTVSFGAATDTGYDYKSYVVGCVGTPNSMNALHPHFGGVYENIPLTGVFLIYHRYISGASHYLSVMGIDCTFESAVIPSATKRPNLITTNGSTGIETTNATIHGYVEGTVDNDMGFIYDTQTHRTRYEYAEVDNINNYYDLSTYDYIAQNFTLGTVGPGIDAFLIDISLLIGKNSASVLSDDLHIELQEIDGAYNPDGIVLAYAIIDGVDIVSTTPTWFSVSLNTSYPLVFTTNDYCIVIYYGTSGAAQRPYIYYSNTNPYAGGHSYKDDGLGGGWDQDAGNDIAFGTFCANSTDYSGSQSVGTYTTSEFEYDVTLSQGNLYHFRASTIYASRGPNDDYFGDEDVFLTQIDPPTLLNYMGYGNSYVNISWDHGLGYNHSVLVMNTDHTPVSITDGTIVYNNSDDWYNTTFTPNTHYYFSCWEFVDKIHYFQYNTTEWINTTYNDFSDTYASIDFLTNREPIISGSSSSILTTSVLISYEIEDDGGVASQVNLRYGLDPTMNSTVDLGVKANGTYTYSLGSLAVADYYYWCLNITNTYFTNESDTYYFLTKPNIPTALSYTNVLDEVTLCWTNPTFGADVNHSIYIRYSIYEHLIGNRSDGYFGGNVSDDTITISGLTRDTTYYFALWTYVNATGSPLLSQFSDNFATLIVIVDAGVFNITIRYENTTYGLVDLTLGSNHTFIVQYANYIEYNFFNETGYLIQTGTKANQTVFDLIDEKNGTFAINLTHAPVWVEFRWNDSEYVNYSMGNSPYRCNRIIIPQYYNFSIYIMINKLVYTESSEYWLNNTLVKYKYSFIDQTGLFTLDKHAWSEIFQYDRYGNKLIIHSQYFDTELKIYPWLLYDKKYFIGVHCDDLDVANLGITPTDENTQPQIVIPYQVITLRNFWDYISFSFSWSSDTAITIDYFDTTYSSSNVTMNLYYLENGTLADVAYYNNDSTITHTFNGLNNYFNFNVEIIVINELWLTGKSSGRIPIYGSISTHGTISNSTLNSYFELIFGKSPMYGDMNSDGVINENTEVAQWTYMFIFFISFIFLVSFGKVNVYLGGMMMGFWFVGSQWFITGLSNASTIILIGVFVVALSIIGLVGGRRS